MNAYTQGFMDKCAAAGVDVNTLMKYATFASTGLRDMIRGGVFDRTKQPSLNVIRQMIARPDKSRLDLQSVEELLKQRAATVGHAKSLGKQLEQFRVAGKLPEHLQPGAK